MSAHGRHGRPPAAAATARRIGPFTLETLLVLGLLLAITGGSFLMSEVRPTVREQKVVVGGQTVRVKQAGTGGVLPGALEPRVIPVAPPTPIATPTATPTKAPKTPKPTPTPTAEVPLEPGPEGPPPLIPGGPGPGSPGQDCTLGLLCSAEPDPPPATEPEPADPPAEDPVAEPTPQPEPEPAPTPKKTKKPAVEDPPVEE